MNLERKIASRLDASDDWVKPTHYKLDGTDDDSFEKLLDSNDDIIIHDPIDGIAEELYELRHPAELNTPEAQRDFAERMKDAGLAYGEWVHLPWHRSVTRYPEKDDHRTLRTFRNQHLVTADEQQELGGKTLAFFGLSVGSNVVDMSAMSGTGERFIFGDRDTVSPTNLNRIRGRMSDVGRRKIGHVARVVSEIDPFIEQYHVESGFGPEAEELMDRVRPDIIVEEMDDTVAKAQLRRYAKANGIPVVMGGDIGENARVMVERYDLDSDLKPFNGAISRDMYEDLLAIGADLESEEEKSAKSERRAKDAVKAMIAIAGLKEIVTSPRLIQSHADIAAGNLAGLPQLGATAREVSVLTHAAMKEILLGRRMDSGNYSHNPRKTLKGERLVSLGQHARMLIELKRAQK